MLRPYELEVNLHVKLADGFASNTEKVWAVLTASAVGDLEQVKRLVEENPALIFAQYNYTPPIHFAVREGHTGLVRYFLENGAYDPTYKTYPFNEPLQVVAEDRGLSEIVELLDQYCEHPEGIRFRGDNGEIDYDHDADAVELQRNIAKHEHSRVSAMLDKRPDLIDNRLLFWGEGILCRSANDPDMEMLQLLTSRGARVPQMSKWGRAYYFKHYDVAEFLIEHGMNARHTTWHQVTLLHDMAQEGDIMKAELLLDHGAEIDAVDEEYCSTPLGLAARWGRREMVEFLLKRGADPRKSGAQWGTPLAWAETKGHQDIEQMLKDAF